jgi:RNA polymerase sigma-70 factor (ECF subfamily)
VAVDASAPEDERLLIQACKRDPLAFGQLYDRYFECIYTYCLRRLASVADAEDVTAQTFLKALDKLGSFRWQGIPIAAWLYRIATNEIHSFLRRQRTGTERQIALDAAGEPWHSQRGPHEELEKLEAELLEHQAFLCMHAAMREMSLEDQDLLSLRFFENKSFPELATILGAKPGTLAMRCSRALARLKQQLEKRGVVYERFAAPVG